MEKATNTLYELPILIEEACSRGRIYIVWDNSAALKQS
jgi:hypothetical protein